MTERAKIQAQTMSLDGMLKLYLETDPNIPNRDGLSYELETRFGTKGRGAITKMDYDNVVNKLINQGFATANPVGKNILRIQSEYLDGNTGRTKISNVRCEIQSLDFIQKYCKTNSIADESMGKAITFQQKMSIQRPDKSYIRPVDNNDFGFRTALQIEKELNPQSAMVKDMKTNWSNNKKIFRYMNRVTFTHETFPIKVDLSIVKNSKKNSKGFSIPEYTMEAADVLNDTEHYEIEIEVDNNRVGPSTSWSLNDLDGFAMMYRMCIKYVLAGLQETNFPVSLPEQSSTIDAYVMLIEGVKEEDEGKFEPRRVYPRDFIGPSSVTLQISNIAPVNEDSTIPNIRNDYTVTDKADGLRKLMYINNIGKIFLITTNMKVQFTGAITSNKELFNTLLDGEHILHNKKGQFINLYAAFDIYFINRSDVRKNAFIPPEELGETPLTSFRFPLLVQVMSMLKPSSIVPDELTPIRIANKKFYDSKSGKSIFEGCQYILSDVNQNSLEYNTDGLIFTPMFLGVGSDEVGKAGPITRVTWEHSFKWKPPEHNTIDFLVTIKKTDNGEDQINNIFQEGTNAASTDQIVQYKTLILHCGFDERKHGFINPCQDVIDNKVPEPLDKSNNDNYKPVPFYPTNPTDQEAHICKIAIQRDGSDIAQLYTEAGEMFEDNTIVEFRYDNTKDNQWRWIPIKVRYDKTAELRNGIRNFGNAYHVANTNWHTIHNPITHGMITSGAEIPDELGDDDVYYNKVSGKSQTRAMRDFHNLFVKKYLIMHVSKYGDTLIDYAVGKGGDIPKWIQAKLSFVFGIDISRDNIENKLDGACARYLNYRRKFKIMPSALFVYGNSGVNIKNGDAMFTEKGKQITKAVFGEGPKDKTVLGEGVYNQYGKAVDGFNVSSCQFALHYFFESSNTLHNYLKNLSQCTAVNGYFIGSCYDGKTMFTMLKSKKQREGLVAMKNGKKIIEITKEYGNDSFEDNITCVGYPINVYQESINKTFREYLVNFDYLTRVLENYGFVLASKEDVESMKLPSASGLFNELYTQMERDIKRNNNVRQEVGDATKMSPEEKKISFANRYFVYKKVRNVDAEAISLQALDQTMSEEKLEKMETAQAVATIKKTQRTSKIKVKTQDKPRPSVLPEQIEEEEASLLASATQAPDASQAQPSEVSAPSTQTAPAVTSQTSKVRKPKKKLLIKPATERTLEESLARPQEPLEPPPQASTQTAKKRPKTIKIKPQVTGKPEPDGEGKGPVEEPSMMNNIITKVSNLISPITSPLVSSDLPEKEVKEAEKRRVEIVESNVEDDDVLSDETMEPTPDDEK